MKKEIIGQSVGGKDILMRSSWSWWWHVLFQFGLHGNEVGTIKLAQKLLEYIDLGIYTVPDSLTLHIIPCLHVDGFALAWEQADYFWWGKVGKRNANDVEFVKNICLPEDHNDISTVFIAWQEIQVSAGEAPFSEPETQALKWVIDRYAPVLLFDYHNAYPAIWGAQDTLWELVATKYRALTWWWDWEQLYTTPDVKRYASKWMSTVFIEWTNRWASDRWVHKAIFPEILKFISENI